MTSWIYGDYDLVKQFIEGGQTLKQWLEAQGSTFVEDTQPTLIGALWYRENEFVGATIDGVDYPGRWGTYFKAPMNTVLATSETAASNKIMLRTTAEELIVEDGRVTGVKATQYDGTPVTAHATKGVVIATGGYAANLQMVVDTNVYWSSDYLSTSTKTTNRSSLKGDGITMAQAVGADVTGMGYTQMMPISWKLADKRTYVHWAEKKYDVLVFGMPQKFHYGDGMGTNPIMMMQALSAQVLRFKRVMSDNCVIICSSICNGYFHDELWPYLREQYELFQHDHMNTLPDMNRLGEYFATNEEYIRKYRYTNAFHPFHGFSMMSCGHIAEMNTSAIYIVGAEEPGYARGMGLKTRATFEEALADAEKKFVGSNPNILALPMTFKKAAVHLCMKNPEDDCMDEYGHRHNNGGCGCC